MILEMRHALEEVKNGKSQGYRRLYDATYEEVYCRSLLIIQKEDQALEFIRDFYKELFGVLDEADEAADQERWFLHRFYQKLRKHYHRLLGKQEKDSKGENDVSGTLADTLTVFPLLHRIMLVMSCGDDFTAAEISAIYGLTEDKIQTEIEKLKKMFPNLTEDRLKDGALHPENWKVLLRYASAQVAGACSGQWADTLYTEAAKAAGVFAEPAEKKTDDFEYFVAEPELDPEPEKPKKKLIPVEEEEPEEDYEEEDEDDGDDYEDDGEDEDDDEDDDRYDWDVEDDGKRMVILGIILALIIVAVVGFAAFRLLGNKDDAEQEPVQTEQDVEENDEKLIVKGGDDSFGEEEPEETPEEVPEETPEETPEEEPQEEEPQTTVMKVKPGSMNVRSEPNTNCEVIASAKAGDRLEVIGEASEDGWVKVRCIDQDGKEGYAKLENLTAE